MKNIIWGNLIQNIIRCIIAYPLFLIAFVISFPFNIFGLFIMITEILLYYSFRELIIVLFPVTWWIYEKINDFNESLYPIKGS